MTVNKDIFEAKTFKTKVIFAYVDAKFWIEIRLQKLAHKIWRKKNDTH